MTSILLSMFWCLLGAFLLGGLFGWALKALPGENKPGELENAGSARFRQKEQELETSHAEYQTRIAELDSRLATSAATIKAQETRLGDWDAKYEQLQIDLANKVAASDKVTAEAAALGERLARAETSLAEKTKAQTELTAELGALRRSLASQEAELSGLKKRAGEVELLAGQISDWEKKYLSVVQERDARDVELGKMRSRISELEPLSLKARDWEMKFLHLSGDKENEINELQKRVSELEPFRSQAKDWEVKYLAVMKDKDSETTALRQRISQLEPLSARVGECQTAVSDKDAEIRQLRQRINQLESAGAPAPAKATTQGDLIEIEGIGEVYYAKLAAIGLTMQAQMLRDGATTKGRREIADKSGISEALILRWVNHIDLIRINGVGPQYAELLEAAGVDTVPELAQRNPDNLHPKLAAVNEERHLVRRLPTPDDVRAWVAAAKTLPRVVTH